jgi:hypothetical protein
VVVYVLEITCWYEEKRKKNHTEATHTISWGRCYLQLHKAIRNKEKSTANALGNRIKGSVTGNGWPCIAGKFFGCVPNFYATSKILLSLTNPTVIYIQPRICEQTCIFLWDFPRKELGAWICVNKHEPLSLLRGYPEVYGNLISLAWQISGHCLKLGQGHFRPHPSHFIFHLSCHSRLDSLS